MEFHCELRERSGGGGGGGGDVGGDRFLGELCIVALVKKGILESWVVKRLDGGLHDVGYGLVKVV